MNVFGSATLIWVIGWSKRLTSGSSFSDSSEPTVSIEAGEQGDRGNDRGADRESLRDRLGGVTDGVEAHHDALGLAVELTGHLRDAGGVVGHGPKVSSETMTPVVASIPCRTARPVEGELQVAAAKADRRAQRDGDEMMGTPTIRARTRCRTAPWSPARCGLLRQCRGLVWVSVELKYSVRRLSGLCEDEADDDSGEHAPNRRSKTASGPVPSSLPT